MSDRRKRHTQKTVPKAKPEEIPKEDTKTKPKAKTKTTQTPRQKIISKGGKMLWGSITIFSLVLNFNAYRSNVSVDYASSIIPENQLDLPFRVSNNSKLPITIDKYEFFTNNMKFENNIFADGNH
jgi:hypothetical protein